jgi:uncharacterized membrane protein
MIVGWIIMAAVIIFAVYGLMYLLRKSDSSGAVKTAAPLDILKERLARGEIDSEEYQRIKDELLR